MGTKSRNADKQKKAKDYAKHEETTRQNRVEQEIPSEQVHKLRKIYKNISNRNAGEKKYQTKQLKKGEEYE